MNKTRLDQIIKTHFSEDNKHEFQEILKFFEYNPSGFYIEIGANDPKHNSMTYALEQEGWTGILVEPLEKLYESLKIERPNSQVFKMACTAPDKKGTLTLYSTGDSCVMASLEKNIDDWHVDYTKEEQVEAKPLDELLDEVKPANVDFVSIDVEGTELDVLKGFNLNKYQPKLIILEDKLYSLDKHRYLLKNGYKLVKRTTINNWYVPKAAEFRQTTFKEKLRLLRKVSLVGVWINRYKRWARTKRV